MYIMHPAFDRGNCSQNSAYCIWVYFEAQEERKMHTLCIVTIGTSNSTYDIAKVKCILVAHICVCLCVCLSLATFPHYCTEQDVTWENSWWCPLVVHHGRICNRYTGFVAVATYVPNVKCQRGHQYSLYHWLASVIGEDELRWFGHEECKDNADLQIFYNSGGSGIRRGKFREDVMECGCR